jgi:hypothetical protein
LALSAIAILEFSGLFRQRFRSFGQDVQYGLTRMMPAKLCMTSWLGINADPLPRTGILSSPAFERNARSENPGTSIFLGANERSWLSHLRSATRPFVTGHWSLVTGHWSLVTGHWSEYYLRTDSFSNK